MCDCNKQIEHYGNIHLNPNEYPIPQDERGIHKCETGMYPCDHFPDEFHMPVTPECPIQGPISRNHATDPKKRYKYFDQQTHNVGAGCMNLNCMCPNCNGDCKCAKETIILGGFNTGLTMTMLVGAAFIVFILYYLYNRKN
jgi:hypothetical protein